MAEEVTEPAQNETVEPDTTTTAPPAAETETAKTPETEGQAETTVEAKAEETVGESERKPSRAERRIKELNGQVKQLQQQSQLPQTAAAPPQFDLMQFTDADGNVDVAAANQAANSNVVQAAQSIADLTVQQRLAQDRAVQNVERDTEVLPTKYPELNPDGPDFSPEIEQAITEEYQEKAFRIVGHNPQTGQPVYALDPSVRLSAVAERYMKVARAAATKSSASMKNAVAQTADTAAIKPSGDSGKTDKAFGDLSIAEMEAKLGPAMQR